MAKVDKNGQTRAQNPDSYNKGLDKQKKAKPVGYRYTNKLAKQLGIKDPSKKPSASDIEKYLGRKKNGKYVYSETRKNKSDVKPKDKLAKGGKTAQNYPQSPVYNEFRDLNKKAKPVGYRYNKQGLKALKISNPYAKPTRAHIEKYLDKYVYYENRADKSDMSIKDKLAKGGKTPQTDPQGANWSPRRDKLVRAKPYGYRYTEALADKLDKTPTARPTQQEIAKYKDKKKGIYWEGRKDKSDLNPSKKFDDGGDTEMARGGKTKKKDNRMSVVRDVSLKEMNYSELKKYINDKYIDEIKKAEFYFNIYGSGDYIEFVGDSIRDQHKKIFENNADYREKDFEKKTGLKVDGFEIQDEEGNELNKVDSGNTYNQSYLGGADFNWRIYESQDKEKYYLMALIHMGGDIRGGYVDAFFFEGDSQDEVLERFYSLLSGGATVYLQFKDGSSVGFQSQQDSDVWYFEPYDRNDEPTTGLAKQYLEDFESFGSWEGDEFLERTIEEFHQGKKVRSYMDGGDIDNGKYQGKYARGGQAPSYKETYFGNKWTRKADKKEKGKRVGYRYTDDRARNLGVSKYAKPTQAHIEKYLGNGIYFENRKDKSDVSPKEQLAKGGKTAQTFAQDRDTYNEFRDIQKTAKPVGYRYNADGLKALKIKNPYAKPSQAHIDKYKDKYVYWENRADKSDQNPKAKLESGGDVEKEKRERELEREMLEYDRLYRYGARGGMMADGEMMAKGGQARISNSEASSYAENHQPFKGNNLESKTLENGDYVVLSYGYYPIWYWNKKENKWYQNKEKFSQTTARHITASRPTYDAQVVTRDEMDKMMAKSLEGNGFMALGGELSSFVVS